MNATKPREHTRTRDDFRAVVGKPAAPPTGRAVADDMDPKDVSYQPSEQERLFIAHNATLPLESVAKAEAECVIRRSLNSFQMTIMRDRDLLRSEAKKFGVTLTT